MRRNGRSVVFVLCASLLVGGASLWHWMNRPPLKLRCPGGVRPEAVVVGSMIAAGHGAMWGAIRLDGEILTAKSLMTVRPDRELTATEKQRLFERLEHPKELGPSFIGAEGTLHVAYDCPGGGFREEELSGTIPRRFTVDWLFRDPLAALRSFDPRPRRVVTAAYEVMGIAGE